MRARTKLVSIGTALPAVALMAHGCREATQVTLDIGTNVVCADMRGVEIVIAPDPRQAEHRAALDAPGIRFATATTTACTEGTVPRKVGTLVVTPAGGEGAVVVVGAFGSTRPEDCVAPRFAPGCIVARRKFSFVDHTPVTLPIILDPVCAGVPCNENSTCVGKKCVDSAVDCASGTCSAPGELADGGLLEVDAPSSLDGAPIVDASEDGGDAAAVDSATGEDAAGDSSVKGDAGNPGYCLPSVKCLDGVTLCSGVGGAALCCYASNPPTCTAPKTCLKMSGCCRNADDCNAGDICCASTKVESTDTTVVCRSRTDCFATGGAPVCNALGGAGCGVGFICGGGTYSNSPQYFNCS